VDADPSRQWGRLSAVSSFSRPHAGHPQKMSPPHHQRIERSEHYRTKQRGPEASFSRTQPTRPRFQSNRPKTVEAALAPFLQLSFLASKSSPSLDNSPLSHGTCAPC